MKILIGCEESQAVTIAFRKRGFEAYSCDLQPCSGGHPEWHLQMDVFKAIAGEHLLTQDLGDVYIDKWDAAVFHPTCTFLAVSGASWMYHPEDKNIPVAERRPHPKHPNRKQEQADALNFVRALMDCDIDKIAIENPVSVISSQIRKPDQIIQPWQFGDEAQKTTCLWLKNLPKLEYTGIVGKGEMVTFESGKTMPKWYVDALTKSRTPAERKKATQ